MIREIELIDFMSHRHTVIEPAMGLTVLLGPNNCGKSAVVSALQILSVNSRKDHMIRHGCRECAITVETDDGHTVTWRRKGKTVHYTIDGQDVHRLEGGVPDGLHGILKLAPVESVEGGESFDVHFAMQKEPVFLLNGTGRQAAMFFASSSDASRLMAMQQRHKEKTREHAQMEKILITEIKAQETRLESLSSIAVLQEASERIAREEERLHAQSARMARLDVCIAALSESHSVLRTAEERRHVLMSLEPPPNLKNYSNLEELIADFLDISSQVIHLHHQSRALSTLPTPPDLTDPADLERILDAMSSQLAIGSWEEFRTRVLKDLRAPPALTPLADITRMCEAISAESTKVTNNQAIVAALDDMPAPPEWVDTKAPAALIDSLAAETKELTRRKREVQKFETLDLPPDVADTQALAATIGRFDEITSTVSANQTEVNELGQQLAEMRTQINLWTEANPTCPTCGAVMDPGRVFQTMEAHPHG